MYFILYSNIYYIVVCYNKGNICYLCGNIYYYKKIPLKWFLLFFLHWVLGSRLVSQTSLTPLSSSCMRCASPSASCCFLRRGICSSRRSHGCVKADVAARAATVACHSFPSLRIYLFTSPVRLSHQIRKLSQSASDTLRD